MIWTMLLWLAVPEDYVARRDKHGEFHVKHIDDVTDSDIVIDRSAARAPDRPAQGLLAGPSGAPRLSESRNDRRDDEPDEGDSQSSTAHWWILLTH